MQKSKANTKKGKKTKQNRKAKNTLRPWYLFLLKSFAATNS